MILTLSWDDEQVAAAHGHPLQIDSNPITSQYI